jgi:galacturan 1,4-alpha-galacturonidase
VKFESIVMRNVTNPIIVDQGISSDDPPPSSPEAVALVHHTLIRLPSLSAFTPRDAAAYISVRQAVSLNSRAGKFCAAQAATASAAVQVEKINYIDITGTSASERAVTFSCSDARPCRRLSLVNVNLTQVDGSEASSYCRQAFGRSVGTVVPESCLSKEDFVHHVPPQRSEEDGEDSES